MNITKAEREKRIQERREMVKREIEFQFSHFSYTKSTFYVRGTDDEIWFSVENANKTGDILNLSQVMIKEFDSFITAGITLSVNEEVKVSEMRSIIYQSLHLPLTLDVMMQMITTQERFTLPKQRDIYPGILFLGSKLTILKAIGWEDYYQKELYQVGQVFYPAMHFHDYTPKGRGLWLPEVVHESCAKSNFSTAVSIE